MRSLTGFALVLALVLMLPAVAPAQSVHADADRVLRAMGDFLTSTEQFTVELEVAYDVFSDEGQELQYGGQARITVRRPDGFRVRFDGDLRSNQLVFDAGAMTMLDERTNLFASAELASDIDGALDEIFTRFGFSVPVADLIYSDPYAVLMENVEFGSYIGLHRVDGVRCHHLAFSQENLDWQIWIEDGPRPMPRQLVLTYKNEVGHPRYSARLTSWNLENLSDSYFEFRPPPGAKQVELMPVEAEVTE